MTALWAALGVAALAGLALLLWRQRRRGAPSALGLPAEIRRVYTTHAKERMAQRGISLDQVDGALTRPDRVDRDDREGSMRFEKDLPAMLLKVWVAAYPWPPVDQVVVKTTAVRHLASFAIRKDAVGRVIGRGGSTIREVQDKSGAKVSVRKDGVVQIRADHRSHVDLARRMVVEIAARRTGPATRR